MNQHEISSSSSCLAVAGSMWLLCAAHAHTLRGRGQILFEATRRVARARHNDNNNNNNQIFIAPYGRNFRGAVVHTHWLRVARQTDGQTAPTPSHPQHGGGRVACVNASTGWHRSAYCLPRQLIVGQWNLQLKYWCRWPISDIFKHSDIPDIRYLDRSFTRVDYSQNPWGAVIMCALHLHFCHLI